MEKTKSMRTSLVATVLLLGFTPVVCLAQASPPMAVLRGFVLVDSTEAPLPGADVAIETLGLRAQASADGAFRLGGIGVGTYMVLVRALGYQPLTVRMRFSPGDSLERDFLLVRSPVTIAGVNVTAKGDTIRNAKMMVFEARRSAGTGHFLTQSMLDSMAQRRLGDIIASRVSGAYVVNRSSSAWVAARRGRQSLTRRQGIQPADIARGADTSACYAAVYLDGTLVYGGNSGESLFDVNSLQTSEVAGVEYYAGAAQVPTELNATSNTCGVLVIWTR
jgi:hypothetical protein